MQEESIFFYPSEEEKKLFIDKLKRLKIPLAKPIFILNPNAKDIISIRRWGDKNFIFLGKKIRKDFPDATILITGNLKEKERTAYIASSIEGAFSIAGLTSLKELLILYCISDILITNDSGPAHFSSLTPIRAIILFGPETHLLYGPLVKGKEVITSKLVCSPCISVYNQKNSPCKDAVCLKNITVEKVYKKIKELLTL